MADWLEPFLVVTPWMAWFFAGIGVPWALVLLPRRDWQDWPTVIGVGLALGPVLGTSWLFLNGTFGRFDFGSALWGTVMIAGVGVGLVYRRRRRYRPVFLNVLEDDSPRFRALTFTLLVMMGIGLLASAWDTAFWPFLRYDTLWTFGYNPKIFMMERSIPDWISYYPQLVPLTYTFGDLAWGDINDHAARAAVPWFVLSSTIAAYLLGWRVYGRRLVGMITAALWLLLPSALVWSSSGDLEHPMALYFTMATVFFVLAWRHDEMRYAIIAGLMAGAAMWTKPTGGAYAIGVGFVMAIAAGYAVWRRDYVWFRKKFRLAVFTGLTSAPIGGMWYLRNILLGHNWTDMPPDYWNDLAQRSGMQLNWLWLLAGLAAMAVMFRSTAWRDRVLPLVAFGMISLAVLPTALSIPDDGWSWETSWGLINGFREPARRMNAMEGGLVLVGIGLLVWSGRRAWQTQKIESRQAVLITGGIGLPFFLVYFWSFSYHYRLGLTVLPLILAPIAALLAAWVIPFFMQNRARRIALLVVTVALGVVAPIATAYHTALNTFNDTGIDTDREKYAYANPALIDLVKFLENYADGRTLDILIPGENRLHFYFPAWDIDDKTLPTDVVDLRGYDLFIPYAAEFLWDVDNLIPNQVWAWTRLAWVYPLPANGQQWALDGPHGTAMSRVLQPVFTWIDDGKDRYEIFRVNVQSAFREIEPETPMQDVIYGDQVQLLGYDLPSRSFQRGEAFTFKLYWQGVSPISKDYSVYVHLLDAETGEIIEQADGGLMGGLFPMRLLTPGMVFQDRREWFIEPDTQLGTAILRIGLYEPGGPRLQATVEGEAVGDGVIVEQEIIVLE